MSTQKNNNDTKKAAGYFKEKFTIGLSRVTGDEVTRAIMKTTSHMLKAPNEKHLQRLLSATHGHFSEAAQKEGVSMCRYIVEELEKRSHTHNWIVVLKTMLTFHALLIDGSDDANKIMQRNRNLFCGRSIKDLADGPDGAAQQRFITAYIRYLEERNITQMRIDLEVRIESSEYLTALKMMPMNILAQALTQLLQQLECIAVIEFREECINNFATLEAYTRLINDGAHLYAFISDRMVYALEHFEELETRDSKVTWITVYKRYSICIQHLRILFEKMRQSRVAWGSVVIPQIREFPEALLTKLEDNLNNDVPTGSRDSGVPEVEDIDSVLASETQNNEKEESNSVPPTAITRAAASANPEESGTSAKAPEVNLFGNGPFNEASPIAQEAPQVPAKPKLPDLDELFGATANATSSAPSQTQMSRQPETKEFDIFSAPQKNQPAWQPTTNAANQFGYASSSSGSGASPTVNSGMANSNAMNDLFGQTANGAGMFGPTVSSGVPTQHHQQQPSNLFGAHSSDFAPIQDSSAINRFDPFGQPPKENIFSATSEPSVGGGYVTNNATSLFGANDQTVKPKPKTDLDDLFGN